MGKKIKDNSVELNAAEQMFFDRLEKSANSKNQMWFENADFLPYGSMYHTGGEAGIYIRIKKDGYVNAGNYTGAVPDINNAELESIIEGQFPNHHEAVNYVMGFAGMRFYADTMTEASERIRRFVESEHLDSAENDFISADCEKDYDEYDEDLEI